MTPVALSRTPVALLLAVVAVGLPSCQRGDTLIVLELQGCPMDDRTRELEVTIVRADGAEATESWTVEEGATLTEVGARISGDPGSEVQGTLQGRGGGGEPIWEVMERYLKAQKTIKPLALNLPEVEGMAGNPGMA